MTWEEARAQFPVLERFAYLNAGTNGPLARATAEASRGAACAGRRAAGAAAEPYFERALALRDEVRARLARRRRRDRRELSRCDLDDERLQHRPRRPRARARTTRSSRPTASTSGCSGRSAASPARVRVAARPAAPPEESLDAMLARGHTADAADRALPRLSG